MRIFPLIALTLSAASLLADSNYEERVNLLECKMQKVRGESVYACRSGARFASGRPVTCGYNLSVFGDVLYWRFYEGGNDYTVKNSTILPGVDGSMEKLYFEWETGYRLGLSCGFSDQWDMTANYTHMKSDGDDEEHAPAGGELEFVSPFGVNGANGGVSAILKYSVLNLEMGSSYFVSRSFYLRPHFGAQAAWIHQKMIASSSGNSVYNRFQNNFTGGGLRIGMDTKWFFHRYWNLVFNASTSALYGECQVSMRDNSTSTVTHVGADIHRIVPSVQSLVGLCWEMNFAEDNNHISLLLAYENSYWWRQNQLVRFENSLIQPPYGTRLSEDLGSQGLTFDVTLFF
ncbi:MAG: mOMP-like family protein [Parachlamydiales bacterium]|nr:mOMP-like family protein [Parachlamydiales bacterium]